MKAYKYLHGMCILHFQLWKNANSSNKFTVSEKVRGFMITEKLKKSTNSFQGENLVKFALWWKFLDDIVSKKKKKKS